MKFKTKMVEHCIKNISGRLGGKRGAGVLGYGVRGPRVRGPGVRGPGVWKTRGLVENTGSGGKHEVSVENTGSKCKTLENRFA